MIARPETIAMAAERQARHIEEVEQMAPNCKPAPWGYSAGGWAPRSQKEYLEQETETLLHLRKLQSRASR